MTEEYDRERNRRRLERRRQALKDKGAVPRSDLGPALYRCGTGEHIYVDEELGVWIFGREK